MTRRNGGEPCDRAGLPIHPSESQCPHCFGIGYDASGQRCTCTEMPIQFVPIQRWRVALQGIAKLALYVCALAVIAGPTLIMILASKPEACTPSKPAKLILYPRQT